MNFLKAGELGMKIGILNIKVQVSQNLQERKNKGGRGDLNECEGLLLHRN
jgi:hypothetical protein